MEGRRQFVNQAHHNERALAFLEGELCRWQAFTDGTLSLAMVEALTKAAWLKQGGRIDHWDGDCGCERSSVMRADRCVECGGVVPLFERGFRREVA